jgi:hypothetical protein
MRSLIPLTLVAIAAIARADTTADRCLTGFTVAK